MGKLRTLAAAVLAALVALPLSARAQSDGVIAGRVTAAENGSALAGATVAISGSNRRTVTNAQGEFRLGGLSTGTYAVTVALIGREGASRQVRVVAGQTATANFTLGASAVAIEGLVATATGEQTRAREVGVNVGVVNVAEDVSMAATSDITQVLQGRTAGVSVLAASGTSGTGARIRIRGNNSVSLSNDPLLIIDGVRADNSGTNLAVGGQTTSRLTDINPEEIESIEVLKGPAASSLYGTAAANGVLVITTKKGRAGRTRFNAYTELGTMEDVTKYPANVTGYCSYDNGGAARVNTTGCDIGTYGDPGLVQDLDIRLDSIVGFNPLEDSRTTPFRNGPRTKYGLNASGGTERATFFLSGDVESEGGVYKYDLNTLNRANLRANVRAQLTDQLDLTVNTGFAASRIRLPQNDNNALGVVSGALLSSRIRYDSVNQGYGFNLVPRQIANIGTNDNTNRFTASALANYRPLSWLSLNGQVGLDAADKFEFEHVPPNSVPYSATYLEGYRDTYRQRGSSYTANLNSTATFNLSQSVLSTTSAGVQYNEEIFRGIGASGDILLAGTGSLGGAAARFAVTEGNTHVRTIGGYLQQQIGLNDRLFLTGAVRGDRNSAFGRDFGFVFYPSVSASWVILEEPFFPEIAALSTLRLRTAYGTSGLRPGSLDAVQYYTPVTANVQGASTSSFTVGGAGNVELRPEKSTELELGLDAGLFNDRLGLEFTYFDKESRDALISAPLAPSLGSAATRRENLGSVINRGTEWLLNARLVERGAFRWDATVSHTRIHNELTDLGERINPIIFGLGGSSQRHTPGRPLGAYFSRPFDFADLNGDGILQLGADVDGNGNVAEGEGGAELWFTSDTAQYVGSPFPDREASFQTNLQFGSWLRVSGLLDYRGGYKNFNSTREFRCGSFFNCPEIYEPETALEDQAAALASAYYGENYGYIEDASFVKLREISVTLGLPRELAERFRTQGLSLTLAGRNLATWTDYKGFDPEINFSGSGSNFSTAEFLTQPPVRYFTARIDLQF